MFNSVEQESVHQCTECLNRSTLKFLFFDDLCSSAPHRVVCDYNTVTETLNIVKLRYGYAFDYNSNLICSTNYTLSDNIGNITSLRRLIITGTSVSGKIPIGFGKTIEARFESQSFSGEIPETMEGLRVLKFLNLFRLGWLSFRHGFRLGKR
ncbi:hypothetical protein L2E82_04538 [Cichorium intybus]|uniref:Uncharacterized protein n=1 Tax=Cichorium intybus TaxID=13427 RepID=A0ACB9H5N5_CICIN|nr:hypothetical protein L2E82_04538 [Cichorium intybus]